jgi:ribosome-binding factor A
MPPRDPHRADRVGEAVREEIAAFLTRDAKDPRITGLVTVTAVEMTRDLRHAKVFVSVMGSESGRAATFDGLKSMAGHLRSRVGKALSLQFAPEISFKLDESVARAARIETLLAGIKDGRPAPEPEDPAGD